MPPDESSAGPSKDATRGEQPPPEAKYVAAYRPPDYVEMKGSRGGLLCILALFSLFLGLGGLVACFVLDLFAIALSVAVGVMAASDLSAMKAGRMYRIDRRWTLVALVLAILTVVAVVAGLAIMIVSFVHFNFFSSE